LFDQFFALFLKHNSMVCPQNPRSKSKKG